MPNLSKTRFCSGLQCLKRLYWQVFPPEDLQENEDEFELILVQGREVGKLARQAFPGGALVAEDHKNLPGALERTKALLADPNVPARLGHVLQNGVGARRVVAKHVELLANALRAPEGFGGTLTCRSA